LVDAAEKFTEDLIDLGYVIIIFPISLSGAIQRCWRCPNLRDV